MPFLYSNVVSLFIPGSHAHSLLLCMVGWTVSCTVVPKCICGYIWLVVVRATAHLHILLVGESFEKYLGITPHVVLRASHNLFRKGSKLYW